MRSLVVLFFCATAACPLEVGTAPAFLLTAPSRNVVQRTLIFAQRVSYQRAIEEVYWGHRLWPQGRPDPKPSLDAVMSQSQLEKKVADYLRDSQALEDYWQRPITAVQLQAEMDRMALRTRNPELLRELFEALGNDPFLIAECLARPALAERFATSWYAYDQRIHGELKQRAEDDLQAHPSIEQMKQLGDKYSEIEFVKADIHEKAARGSQCSIRLSGPEWNQTVKKLAATFNTGNNRASLLPRLAVASYQGATAEAYESIPIAKLSSLQEDNERYYATAIISKTQNRLKFATVAWVKEPFESWRARTEREVPQLLAAPSSNYTLPEIADGGCTDNTWAASSLNMPDGRESHSAVWTGTEMIVWGGYPFSPGGRYNPGTGRWTSVSSVNEPSARAGHTAVWTGSEMIVWGGIADTGVLNTGGRYNPVTDSWVATSMENAPAARTWHTGVWTGSELIVWGGIDDFPRDLNTGGRYNLSTNSWTPVSTTNTPTARDSHTAVWTGSEMIIWGGEDYDSSTYLNTGGRYNPSTNSWAPTSIANAPDGRELHTAMWTGTAMIVWGGTGDSDSVNTGGRYNLATNSWTATSTTNAPSRRYYHTAVWTGNQMIVWGGEADAGYTNSGGRYNPRINSWTTTNLANAPAARWVHTAVWTGSEMIVWGGTGNDYMNTGGRYKPTTDTWATTTGNSPAGRTAHTAVWTGSEMITWGGFDGYGSFNTGGRYSPAIDNWTATSTLNAPTARHDHTAVWTGGQMIIWGGATTIGGIFNTGSRYNPVSDAWTATSVTNAPAARFDHSAVWAGSEMIVWGGGDDSGNVLNTGGKYNPITNMWTATSVANAPSGRLFHSAVWTGNQMIVWGGTPDRSNSFNSGGRYNPGIDSWMATTTSNAPSNRYSHSAIWDGSGMIVWGGLSDATTTNTGGRYAPNTDSWGATNTANAPSARELHTAVWTGGEMIVWGGFLGDFVGVTNTGGRYNPGADSWTSTCAVNVPTERYSHTAVWTGTEMVVWGGFGYLNNGGRYCAQSGPTPSPTPTPTPCTGRCSPTPRPRLTPHPRP